MQEKGVLVIVLGCLIVGSFCHPKQPTFPSCQSSVCRAGANTGYGCRDGVCDYACSKLFCRSADNTVFPQKGILEEWGIGAPGIRGCYGGNCGYWDGCKNGKCKGFYDFKQCQANECVSEPFHGYDCTDGGNCQVVCHGDACHFVGKNGKLNEAAMSPQQTPGPDGQILPRTNAVSKSNATSDGSPKADSLGKLKGVLNTVAKYLSKLDSTELRDCIDSAPDIDAVINCLGKEVVDMSVSKTTDVSDLPPKVRPRTTELTLSNLRDKTLVPVERSRQDCDDSTGLCDGQTNIWHKLDDGRGYAAPMDMRLMRSHIPPAYPMMGYVDGYGFDPMMTWPSSYSQSLEPQRHISGITGSISSLDPAALQTVLLNVPNLNELLVSVDPMLLQSTLSSVTGIGQLFSGISPYDLRLMLNRLPNLNALLATADPALLQSLIAQIPYIEYVLASVESGINQPMMSHLSRQVPMATRLDTTASEPLPVVPDPSNLVEPNVEQIILSTMPNILPQHANALLTVDPGFVRYIIENHQHLDSLLGNMNAQTLHHIIAHVPEFGEILPNLSASTLDAVFDKLPNVAKYFETMDPELVQAIVAKLPSLAKHAPTLPALSPGMEMQLEHDAPKTLAPGAAMFTDGEMELLRTKIPLIDKVMKLMDPNKLAALRAVLPEFTKHLADLEGTKINAINTRLREVEGMLSVVEDALIKKPAMKYLATILDSADSFQPMLRKKPDRKDSDSIDEPLHKMISTKPKSTVSLPSRLKDKG
ncbi:hypothetical protein TSMEX_007634, partial [Taenia solium]|eukprot:TsM_001226600 transcript=TsM_001226600 gene=TsM_001226600